MGRARNMETKKLVLTYKRICLERPNYTAGRASNFDDLCLGIGKYGLEF